jgi:cytochrome bd-type quinol oxidase subunit 1
MSLGQRTSIQIGTMAMSHILWMSIPIGYSMALGTMSGAPNCLRITGGTYP